MLTAGLTISANGSEKMAPDSNPEPSKNEIPADTINLPYLISLSLLTLKIVFIQVFNYYCSDRVVTIVS